MGIKGINQLIKHVCESDLTTRVKITEYSGKKIAVDASIFVFANKMKTNFMESIVETLTFLRERNVHLVFVFDGKAPDEKKDEKARRSQQRAQQYARIEELEADLVEYAKTKTVTPALQTINDTKIRKCLLLSSSTFNAKLVNEYVKKLRSHMNRLTEEDFVAFRYALKLFDIPSLTAEGEGEVMCAQLARRGLVDAVMTKDTDALACCAPVVLTSIAGEYFVSLKLADILAGLNLTKKSWVDLCIMCGTDFNQNVPNYGPVKSYGLVQKHESLEEIEKVLDVSPLNYEKTRELFARDAEFDHAPVANCGNLNYDAFVDWVKSRGYKISCENVKKRLNCERVRVLRV